MPRIRPHHDPTYRATMLGLTGGIGSGKSTVASLLAGMGAAVVDADAVSASLTGPNGAALQAIAQTFGASFVGPHGLDRLRMRELVFRAPAARRQLEAILHPLIRAQMQAKATALASNHAPPAPVSSLPSDPSGTGFVPLIVLVVPLLVEHWPVWGDSCSRVLVVDCDVATQRQRVLARAGMTEETLDGILRAQASRAQRVAHADDLIVNDAATSMDELRAQAHVLRLRWLSNACAPTTKGPNERHKA